MKDGCRRYDITHWFADFWSVIWMIGGTAHKQLTLEGLLTMCDVCITVQPQPHILAN